MGATATSGALRLRGFQVGALPLVNHDLQRFKLTELLRRHLPPDDVRRTIPTERIVLLLVRNVLVSRQPLYAIPHWVARHAPELFDLYHQEVSALQDDRLGDCLARLFHATTPELTLAVVRSAIDEFRVTLDELPNDSTSVSFHVDGGNTSDDVTHRRSWDLLEHVRRYELRRPNQSDDDRPLERRDELTAAQERLLQLFGVAPQTYGR